MTAGGYGHGRVTDRHTEAICAIYGLSVRKIGMQEGVLEGPGKARSGRSSSMCLTWVGAFEGNIDGLDAPPAGA